MTDTFIRRRHFVAIATASYKDPTFDDLSEVPDGVAALRDWLCSADLSDRRFVPRWPELAANPTVDQIRGRMRELARERIWTEADSAVLYVAGRGVENDSSHYVILHDTERDRVTTTALSSADLIAWLADTPIQHLLLVLDAELPGKVAHDVLLLRRQLRRRWLILPSVTSNGTAVTGALTAAIRRFIDELRRPEGRRYGEGPYIDVASFLQDVQHYLGPGEALRPLYGGQLAGPHVCLPNPHYQPEAALAIGASRQEMAISRSELETHWSPRSRGVAADSEPGWLFSGRKTLMRRLIGAITGPPGATIVSGGAGSGKSAALARLVTLSDPQFVRYSAADVRTVPTDLRPPVGSVDVAVLATGKLHSQILRQICTALQVPGLGTGSGEPTVDQRLGLLHSWLAARTTPVTIIIDALDEAADPEVFVREVLAFLEPDPAAPKVRLLIGVRSVGAPEYGGAAKTQLAPDELPLADLTEALLSADRIAVDDAPWWEPDDVVAYVASILERTPGSPYQQADDDTRMAVARAVGGRAGKSFLVARIAASSLASRKTIISPSDPSWLHTLDEGLLGVFRDDLHYTITSPSARRRAVVLLRAVAFAYGSGLPWRGLWPLMANAVDENGATYGDTDILSLLNSRLGAYLVTDRDDGTTVYRLFHDSLRSTLRDRWQELLVSPSQ